MNANELRIGNWVYNKKGKILRIDWWGDTNNIYMNRTLAGAAIRPMTENASDATPIPLTEEWLQKLGLTRTGHNEYDDAIYATDGNVWILQDKDTKKFYLDQYDREIKYVHQLQNIFLDVDGEELKHH